MRVRQNTALRLQFCLHKIFALRLVFPFPKKFTSNTFWGPHYVWSVERKIAGTRRRFCALHKTKPVSPTKSYKTTYFLRKQSLRTRVRTKSNKSEIFVWCETRKNTPVKCYDFALAKSASKGDVFSTGYTSHYPPQKSY